MRVTLRICMIIALAACSRAEAPSAVSSSAPSASATAPTHPPLERERCVRNDCSAEIVVRGQDDIRDLIIVGDRLIWGSWRVGPEPTDSVRVLPKHGKNPQELASGLHGVCALEVSGDHVYFTEAGYTGQDYVRRVPLSGGKPELLATYRGSCSLMVLTSRDLMYGSEGQLVAMPKAGGRARRLGLTASILAARTAGDTLYWSSGDAIYRSNGDRPERLLSASKVYELEITRHYLIASKGGEESGIVRARHDGSDARLLYGGSAHRMAADETHAFIATHERGQLVIRRIALSDGEMALLVRRKGDSPALAVDDTHVYFTDPREGLVLRVRK